MITDRRDATDVVVGNNLASRQTITALLAVHNEERHIRGALDSIAGVVDQIVVMHDGPCEDKTVSIAGEYTDEVSCSPERNGDPEYIRTPALDRCTGDWVLVLDADERLSPALRASLRSLVEDESADAYSFAWPYVDENGRPMGRVSVSSKRFLFRRDKMYAIALPHMFPDTFGETANRRDLEVLHIMKSGDPAVQLRRMNRENRRRARVAATTLAGGLGAVQTFNADLSDKRVKNQRKIRLFANHPFIALVTVPAFVFLHRYFVRGYFRAGLIGLHDALNIPVCHAWTCLYRIRDGLGGQGRA